MDKTIEQQIADVNREIDERRTEQRDLEIKASVIEEEINQLKGLRRELTQDKQKLKGQ